MKGILKNIIIYSFSLYIASVIFKGVDVNGGIYSLFIGGLLLAIGFKILKPILSIISLPFNLLTFGLFNILIVAFILFLITLIYPSIQIFSFRFEGFQLGGFEIKPFNVSLLLSYCIISATIYLTTKLILWLFD